MYFVEIVLFMYNLNFVKLVVSVNLFLGYSSMSLPSHTLNLYVSCFFGRIVASRLTYDTFLYFGIFDGCNKNTVLIPLGIRI